MRALYVRKMITTWKYCIFTRRNSKKYYCRTRTYYRNKKRTKITSNTLVPAIGFGIDLIEHKTVGEAFTHNAMTTLASVGAGLAVVGVGEALGGFANAINPFNWGH